MADNQLSHLINVSIDGAEASERLTTLIQHYKHPVTRETFADESLVHDFIVGDDVWEAFRTFFEAAPGTPRQRRKELIELEESITQEVDDYEHAEIYSTFEDDKWLVTAFMLSDEVRAVFRALYAGKEPVYQPAKP